MLIVTRKVGESVVIGDKIIVKVVSINGEQIRLGVEAPREITILREELLEKVLEENRTAAFQTARMANFYQNWQKAISGKIIQGKFSLNSKSRK